MHHPENPIAAFDSLASSERPFFAFRLPNEEYVTLGSGKIIGPSEFNYQNEAFVIAPFSPSEPVNIIIPEISFQTPQILPPSLPAIESIENSISEKEYVKNLDSLIQILKKRGGKTVIARTIEAKSSISSIGTLFHALCKKYPQSYIYCWKIHSNKFWIGSVPELLLKISGNRIESMSLAGTMKSSSNEEWDKKNLEEQKIVTDFIADTFRNNSLTPNISLPQDKYAGPVKHLCSSISSSISSATFDILSFASKLSPTPAVCGFPRDTAMTEIRIFENMERNFYGGYSGPIYNRKKAFLFVTLRCMTVEPSIGLIRLYVGGGITAQSNPELEWNETCMKATTLLSVFK